MAERLPKYRPLGVSIPSLPTVDYTQTGAAQARVYDAIAKSLDKVSQFAFKQMEDTALIEGAQYGVENAPTKQQLEDAGGDIEDIVPGDQSTVFGKAARKAALGSITTNFDISARQEIMRLRLDAQATDKPVSSLVDSMTAVIDGYTSTIQDVSPSAALKFRSSLSTHGNSVVLAYSQKLLDKQEAQQQLFATSQMDAIVNGLTDADGDTLVDSNIEDVFETGSQAMIEGGVQDYIGIADKLTHIRTQLQSIGASVADKAAVQKYLKQFDDKVSVMFDTEVSQWVMEAPIKHLAELRTGEITDARMADIWGVNMTDTQRATAIKASQDAITASIGVENAFEAQIDKKKKDNYETALVDLADAQIAKNKDGVNAAMEKIRINAPEKYRALRLAITKDVNVDNGEAIAYLERLAVNNLITEDAVTKEYTKGNLTAATYKTQLTAVKSFRDERFRDATSRVKELVGIGDAVLFNPSRAQKEAQKEVARIQTALRRAKDADPDVDIVLLAENMAAKYLEDKNKVKPQVLTTAKSKVEELRGKLGLTAGATIDDISEALIAKNNNKLIDDYAGFVKTVKDNQ